MVTPAAGREAVGHLRGGFAMSERRRAVRLRGPVEHALRRLRPNDDPLHQRLKAVAE